MRPVAICVALSLLFAVPLLSQVKATAVPSGVHYGLTNSAVDQYGNILAFDLIYTWTVAPMPLNPGAPPAGTVAIVPAPMPVRYVMSAKTRVTVIPGVGQPISKEYPAMFQILGAGKALYAAMTEYLTVSNESAVSYKTGPRKLIAIDAGASGALLPAGLSGFLSAELPTTGESKLHVGTGSQPDLIYSIPPPNNSMILTPMRPALLVRPRIARMIRFDGTKFTSADVTLPQ